MVKKLANKVFRELLKISILRDYMYKRFTKKYKYDVKDSTETVNYILRNHSSIARYGDGELDMIWGVGNGFQDYDEMLAKRLNDILSKKVERLMIGVPRILVSCDEYIDDAQDFAKKYVCYNQRRILRTIPICGRYFNTNFSRFYMSYKDKRQCKSVINNIRKIWEGRSVLIVEGSSTRFGVGNDLLSNTRSVKRILCPSKNAFSKYDDILLSIISGAHKEDLIILALGMTATVLAYDLAAKGYQAIDIGHLDIEYEWYLMSAKQKCSVFGKAVNEVGIQIVTDDVRDEHYKKQIIYEII